MRQIKNELNKVTGGILPENFCELSFTKDVLNPVNKDFFSGDISANFTYTLVIKNNQIVEYTNIDAVLVLLGSQWHGTEADELADTCNAMKEKSDQIKAIHTFAKYHCG